MKNRLTYNEFVNEARKKSTEVNKEQLKKLKKWEMATKEAMKNTDNKDKQKLYSMRLKYISSKSAMITSKMKMDAYKESMKK